MAGGRDIAAAAASRGRLRLGVAWLNDVAIAAQFWTVAHGVVEIHKLAYDEDHKALGAGTALSAAMFERALHDDQAHTIDYLIGDDSYKASWMNVRQQRSGLVAGLVHTPRGAWLALMEGLRRLARPLLRIKNGSTAPTMATPTARM